MKIFNKALSSLFPFLAVVLLISGCDFQRPENISIRTKADYNFTVINFKKDFSEDFNSKTLLESFSSGDESDIGKIEIYDYWPDKEPNTQQFLLKVPVRNISLDVSSYFNNLEFMESAQNMSFSQTIKVPEIKSLETESEISLQEYNIPNSGGRVPIEPPISINVKTLQFNTYSTDDSFKECVIGKGELRFEILTDGWEGVTIDWEEISITGGINLTTKDFQKDGDGTRFARLDGKLLTNENTDSLIVIKVGAKLADTTKNPIIKGTCKIDEIESIKVPLPDGTETSINQENTLEIDSTTKNIVLGNSNLVCTYYNTMPDGNNFALHCASDFLGIQEQKETLDAQTSESKPKEIIIAADNGKTGKIIERNELDEFPNIDFNAKFDFGSDDGFITAKNVEPGHEYKIGVDVEIKINWISMDLKMDNFSSQEEDVIDTGINFSSIFKSLEKSFGGEGETGNLFSSIKLKELPLYVYCQTPDIELFDDSSFTGNIILGLVKDEEFMPYSDPETEEHKTLFGDIIEKASIPKLDKENDIITTNIAKCAYSGTADLAGLVESEKEGTLGLKTMNLGLENSSSQNAENEHIFTITKEQLDLLQGDSSNGSSDIEIQAFVILSLNFSVGADSDPKEKVYYISNLFSSDDEESDDGDLFGRTEDMEENTIMNYLKVVKEMRISFDSVDMPFNCYPVSPSLCVNLNIPGSDEKIVPLLGKGNITLDEDEISGMFETVPLKPQIRLGFSKGTFAILRGTEFSTRINIGISTDGTIPLSALKGGD